jgi:hypothetical protein
MAGRTATVGPWLVLCVGKEPWVKGFRKVISGHRSLDRAKARANSEALQGIPPEDDTEALLRQVFGAEVIERTDPRVNVHEDYQWVVVNDRTNQRVYSAPRPEREKAHGNR